MRLSIVGGKRRYYKKSKMCFFFLLIKKKKERNLHVRLEAESANQNPEFGYS